MSPFDFGYYVVAPVVTITVIGLVLYGIYMGVRWIVKVTKNE